MRPTETEYCIVGAGPAGLVLANQLSRAGRDVVLIESGLPEYVESIQELNRGRVLGDPYADLRSVRRRQLGGTVNTWNTEIAGRSSAKYAPLSPIDFEPRPEAGGPGWPIEYGELVPWYEAAQQVCGLGPFEYGAASWRRDTGRDGLVFAAGSGLEARVYQFGLAEALTTSLTRELRDRQNVSIECGLTAVQLQIENSAERAHAVLVRETSGSQQSILRAGTIILATGAIENARLLLKSGGPCNREGWVGRSFMEHPRDYSMRWTPSDPAIYRHLHFYDQHEAQGGVTIMGRLDVDDAALRDHGLTQGSVTLVPQQHFSRGLWGRLGDRLGLNRAARYPVRAAGWSERDPSGENLTSVQLLLNLEQAPHPDNTVRLPNPGAEGRDGPVCLDWRWRPEDQKRLEGLRRIIADAFEGSGHGRVEIDTRTPPDPNAHHHAGTTRMSDDPTLGVVDFAGRIHGLENVYCAGASVFPSAGFANPTLTIVALALRLAAHLAPESGA